LKAPTESVKIVLPTPIEALKTEKEDPYPINKLQEAARKPFDSSAVNVNTASFTVRVVDTAGTTETIGTSATKVTVFDYVLQVFGIGIGLGYSGLSGYLGIVGFVSYSS
jgi:hypothetical protein